VPAGGLRRAREALAHHTRSEAKGNEGISTIRCLHKANNLRFVYLCLFGNRRSSFVSFFIQYGSAGGKFIGWKSSTRERGKPTVFLPFPICSFPLLLLLFFFKHSVP
jgi:hypothetical protein